MWNSSNVNGHWSQWSAFQPASYQNVSHDQVDWAALAQQWIQMKELHDVIPTPSQTSHFGTGIAVSQPMGTISAELSNTGVSGSISSARSRSRENFQWNYWQQWPVNNWNPPVNQLPPLSIIPDSKPASIPENVSTPPVSNSEDTLSAPTAPRSFEYNHGNMAWETGVLLDATKRRHLPAWIREGLEKMEKEKQRKAEKERFIQDMEKQKKLELQAQYLSNRNLQAGNGSDSESLEEMVVVRRVLTEILMEVTTEELVRIAHEVHSDKYGSGLVSYASASEGEEEEEKQDKLEISEFDRQKELPSKAWAGMQATQVAQTNETRFNLECREKQDEQVVKWKASVDDQIGRSKMHEAPDLENLVNVSSACKVKDGTESYKCSNSKKSKRTSEKINRNPKSSLKQKDVVTVETSSGKPSKHEVCSSPPKYGASKYKEEKKNSVKKDNSSKKECESRKSFKRRQDSNSDHSTEHNSNYNSSQRVSRRPSSRERYKDYRHRDSRKLSGSTKNSRRNRSHSHSKYLNTRHEKESHSERSRHRSSSSSSSSFSSSSSSSYHSRKRHHR